MFPDVTSCLQFDKLRLQNVSFAVADDLLGNAGFLVDYCLGYALKQGLRVVLVSWSETFAHYQAICARCGVDLAGPLAKNDLVVFDALAGMESFCDEDLPELVDSIQAALEEPSESSMSTKDCILILDHPSNLLDIGLSSSSVLRFILNCINLTVNRGSTPRCGLFLVLRSSETLVQNEALFSIASQAADVVMKVSTLGSGMSRDVTGDVVVHFNLDPNDYEEVEEKLNGTINVKSERFLYRLESRQVRMSKPGGALLRR